MVDLDGTLRRQSDDLAIENFAVVASLTFEVGGGDNGQASSFSVPASGGARSDAEGRFRIEIDAEGRPQDPVEIRVSAPNGVLVHRLEVDLETLSEPLEIRIDPEAPFNVEPSDVPGLGERLRVSGRVIDEAGGTVPSGLPVVLWGVDLVDGPPPKPRPLLISETQSDGAFGGDWPADPLAEAFGRVAGGPPVPIRLDEEQRLVREILLVTRIAEEEGECDCSQAPPRAPDAVDLTTNPGAFSQDLGGGCVDLTIPNRTLEEFSYSFVVRTSEPRVKGIKLGARRTVPRSLLVDLLGVSLSATALRGARLSSATLGQSELELDVESARYLVRGDAAPRPEAIERAAWLSEVSHARTLIGASLSQLPTRHALDADHAIEWDTPTIYPAIEIAHGHLLEYREVWRADGYSLGDLVYSLPLAPGQRRQIAVVDWERRSRSAREESLEFEEELDALLERDRDIREIVGSDLHETTSAGSRNTTWGVAGGIGAGFIGSGFGIFGGVAGGASGSDSQAWQRSARRFSADSLQQLRDRVGQRSSAVRSQRSTVVQSVAQGETVRAETEVIANYNRCHAITVAYFEVLRHFLVTHELANVQECLFVPFPIRAFDRGKALRWREALGRFLKKRSLRRGFAAIERIADQWVGWDFPRSRYSEEAPTTLEGELRLSFILPRPRDAEDGSFQLAEWEAYRDVLPFFARDIFSRWLEQAVAANKSATAARDEIFQREVAPQIAANLVNRLRFAYVGSDGGETELPLDATLVSRYRENRSLYVTLRPAGDLPEVPREDIAYFKIAYEGAALPPEAKVIVQKGRLRYRTDHISALLFDGRRLLDDLRGGDPVVVATPVSRRELRNPREEDREAADRLVAHLNDHLEFYHQALWHSLDAQRRFMLLDALEVPGQDGRSVASLCSNELLGIVGNSLVLPVSPGQRLDTAVSATDEEGNPVDIRNAYATPPAPALRVSVPTRGVYAEAVAGECSACEAIDNTRYWRWSTEGLLAPPEIQGPIDTGSRASDEPDLTPTAPPAPLVSIQNAPEAPDPFGLGAAFALLSKPDLFRDVTGLEGTQKNAAAAFEAALSAASAVGGEAAKLARQQELSKTSDRIVDRIQGAVDDDLLTPQAAKRLTESVLGGLAGREEPATQAPTENKTIEKAVDKLSQAESGSLKVETPSETVEVSFDDAGPLIGGAAVPATHPLLPAPHNSTDKPVTVEATFEGRPPRPGNDLADDLTPIVLSDLEVLRVFVKPAQPNAPNAESVGMVLPDANGSSYRLRRPLNIVYPAESASSKKAAGNRPLPIVVLQHGAHRWYHGGNFVESYKGYQYLQEELARQGIVSVSVDVNAANVFESTLVDMRAELAVTALDTLLTLNLEPSSVLHGRLDFSNVGLFGHSRGGDAMVAAAQRIASRTPRPLYIVKFVCALSPTDLSGQAKASQRMALSRTDTPFFCVLYGTQDGDVSGAGGAKSLGGTGFRHYDRAETDKSMLFLGGCGHNRFNTVWMQDTGDESGLLAIDKLLLHSEETHRDLLKEYVGALARWRLLGDASGKNLFDGQRLNRRGVAISVQWSFGLKVEVIDDMEGASTTRTLKNASIKPFADTVVGGSTLELETNHQTRVLTIKPGIAAPVSAALVLDLPATVPKDWRSFSGLNLRAAAHFDLSDPATIFLGKAPEFDVVIKDGSDRPLTLKSLPTKGSNTDPDFHRGASHVPNIVSAKTAGAETRITTAHGHGVVVGQIVAIKITGTTPSPLDGEHRVTTIVSTKEFRVAKRIPSDLGAGLIKKVENLSVQRLETMSYLLPPQGVDPGEAETVLKNIRKLEITPQANFPQHIFIDSIELIES